MIHYTLFRDINGSFIVLPTTDFDKAVAEGALTDAEADPICQGCVEEVFIAFDALSKRRTEKTRGAHDQ